MIYVIAWTWYIIQRNPIYCVFHLIKFWTNCCFWRYHGLQSYFAFGLNFVKTLLADTCYNLKVQSGASVLILSALRLRIMDLLHFVLNLKDVSHIDN